MSKVSTVSGFPEWLPEQRSIEQALLAALSHLFELHGYTSIETRSVELIETLCAKGEIEKEVYGLQRLHAGPEDSKMRLGLHFDLTVPFARYVVENEAHLSFPFKRYQIQRVWRGERPQEGRFREFYQADFDMLVEQSLPEHVEIEVADILLQAFAIAPMPVMQLHVSNRSVFDGVCEGIGAKDPKAVLAIVDRLHKVGGASAKQALITQAGLPEHSAELCLEIAALKGDVAGICQRLPKLLPMNALLDRGLRSLELLAQGVEQLHGKDRLLIDLSIVRGLDYYTGVVYEGFLHQQPGLGAICSGGRYDNLTASLGRKRPLPGIGASIGLTRLLSYLFTTQLDNAKKKSPTQVVIALPDETLRMSANTVARDLRSRGIASEIYHAADKFAKQIRYADRKGIRYVLFPIEGSYASPEMRDLLSGEQQAVDLQLWKPSEK